MWIGLSPLAFAAGVTSLRPNDGECTGHHPSRRPTPRRRPGGSRDPEVSTSGVLDRERPNSWAPDLITPGRRALMFPLSELLQAPSSRPGFAFPAVRLKHSGVTRRDPEVLKSGIRIGKGQIPGPRHPPGRRALAAAPSSRPGSAPQGRLSHGPRPRRRPFHLRGTFPAVRFRHSGVTGRDPGVWFPVAGNKAPFNRNLNAVCPEWH